MSVAAFVDPRQPGEALWSSKYPLAELKRRRAGMGEYDWSALYMGAPAPSGGGLFRLEWFRIVDALPANITRRCRGWDTAGTDGGGDWTAGVKIGEADGHFYVEHVVHGQWGPNEVNSIIKMTADVDGKNQCAQREEREGGSSGIAIIAMRTKQLVGHNYEGVSVSGSNSGKVPRSKPFRIQFEAGNVFLLRGEWNARYIEELCGFPTAKHDDQVDASSCAFNALLLEPVVVSLGATWGRDTTTTVQREHRW